MWSSGGELLKEDIGGGGGGGRPGRVSSHWYWGGAGAAQLIWGISSYRKGVAGDGRLMPFKAFAVASLFVGAGASATVASLKSFGINSIDDMKALGENVRTELGKPPRA